MELYNNNKIFNKRKDSHYQNYYAKQHNNFNRPINSYPNNLTLNTNLRNNNLIPSTGVVQNYKLNRNTNWRNNNATRQNMNYKPTDHPMPSRSISQNYKLNNSLPPPGLPVHALPPGLPVHAPPPGLPVHALPPSLPVHAPPPGLSAHALPPGLPVHAPPPGLSVHAPPPGLSVHALPPGLSVHALPHGLSVHALAPGLPVHALQPSLSVHALSFVHSFIPLSNHESKQNNVKTKELPIFNNTISTLNEIIRLKKTVKCLKKKMLKTELNYEIEFPFEYPIQNEYFYLCDHETQIIILNGLISEMINLDNMVKMLF